GTDTAKLTSGKARAPADEWAGRLQKRLSEVDEERKLSPLPPVVLGGALIVPIGLLKKSQGTADTEPPTFALSREESERRAMEAVLETEGRLGFKSRNVSDQNLGYDVESSIPDTGLLRFIEVKGRVRGATTVTITKNEILTGLNKPDEFILAVVLLDPDRAEVRYIRSPFDQEPDFKATSVNYDMQALLQRAQEPA
ncbi:MAG: DUF3883 domain-containing protein, partial [Planctomycetaceae bacterium]